MKDSEIYRAAARMCHAKLGMPSCWAVNKVLGAHLCDPTPQREAYTDMMLEGCSVTGQLFPKQEFGHGYTKAAQRVRVMLLLFMAAIAESEGR